MNITIENAESTYERIITLEDKESGYSLISYHNETSFELWHNDDVFYLTKSQLFAIDKWIGEHKKELQWIKEHRGDAYMTEDFGTIAMTFYGDSIEFNDCGLSFYFSNYDAFVKIVDMMLIQIELIEMGGKEND